MTNSVSKLIIIIIILFCSMKHVVYDLSNQSFKHLSCSVKSEEIQLIVNYDNNKKTLILPLKQSFVVFLLYIILYL